MEQRIESFIALQPIAAPDDDVAGQPVPVPMVITWEVLPPDEYRQRLEALAAWAQWLIDTYAPPASVVPSCWFLHPGMREELGHLHTAWLFTRHPSMGTGPAGVDWDRHRDAALARLSTMVQVSGCGTSRGHQDREAMPRSSVDTDLFASHLAEEQSWRTAAQSSADSVAAAAGVLTAGIEGAKQALADAETKRQSGHAGDESAEPNVVAAGRAAAKWQRTKRAAVSTRASLEALEAARSHLADQIACAALAAADGLETSTAFEAHSAIARAVAADPTVVAAVDAWETSLAAALGDEPTPTPAPTEVAAARHEAARELLGEVD